MTDRHHAALCEKCARKCKQPAHCKIVMCPQFEAMETPQLGTDTDCRSNKPDGTVKSRR